MSTWLEPLTGENRGFYSNGAHSEDVEQLESFGGMAEGNQSIPILSPHSFPHTLITIDITISISF